MRKIAVFAVSVLLGAGCARSGHSPTVSSGSLGVAPIERPTVHRVTAAAAATSRTVRAASTTSSTTSVTAIIRPVSRPAVAAVPATPPPTVAAASSSDAVVTVLYPGGTCGETGASTAGLDHFPVIPASTCSDGFYLTRTGAPICWSADPPYFPAGCATPRYPPAQSASKQVKTT